MMQLLQFISLTPGFSRVVPEVQSVSRFNGFPLKNENR
jgi:hypothetical protein